MRILITGAKGQLGKELIHVLNTGKSDIGTVDCAYENAKITESDIDDVDIADAKAVNRLVKEVEPSIIFNCAAMTNVDCCETQWDVAMKGNAMGPRNLAIASESVGAKLVHISTDYVFSGEGKIPYCEWDSCEPNTVYGKSKLLGEQYISQFCSHFFIVRTAWLYGTYGNNFVKTMLKLGEDKEKINVVNDQRGNPTNANDLAHHMLKLALSKEYGLYHCTAKGECSWFDFATKIMEYAGLPCKVMACTSQEFVRIAPRPSFSSLQNLMLESIVGDEMRHWEAALKTYLEGILK